MAPVKAMKLTKATLEKLSKVKPRPTGAAARNQRYLLQTENDNCTFQPDLATARTSLTADKEAMGYLKQDKMIKHIKSTILPSVNLPEKLKKIDKKNVSEVIGLLLANKRQVEYWGLTEAEMLQITMATAEKLERLDSILRLKEFISRNCPKGSPSVTSDHGGGDFHRGVRAQAQEHRSTSLASALTNPPHNEGKTGGRPRGLRAALT